MDAAQGFHQFSVGDLVVFTRRFGEHEFAAFAELSGDRNPLHHDASYARASGYDRPIVPLHLAAAPLSKVAGMIFPGEPSLYLSQEVRAVSPAPYDEDITYSVRVAAVSPVQRVLMLRVLALAGSRVLFEATMRVQARSDRWVTPPAEPIRRGPGTALVTGAAGEIGTAVAARLVRMGYSLLLHVRPGTATDSRRQGLDTALGTAPHSFVEADLALTEGRAALAAEIGRCPDLSVVLHTASPSVESPLRALIDVNVTALHEMTQAALPSLLARQDGAVIALGTRAVEFHPQGWENYVAAKSAAASLLDGFHRRHSLYGVRGLVLALGYVRTAYSRPYRPPGESALLPEEVADEVASLIARPGKESYHTLDIQGREAGRFGALFGRQAEEKLPRPASADENRPFAPAAPAANGPPYLSGDGEPALDIVLRRVLGLQPGEALASAALGVTPGWDSLRHIELLLEIESALGVGFTSGEIEHTRHYRDLVELCRRKRLSNK